jgi:hypothetical protein
LVPINTQQSTEQGERRDKEKGRGETERKREQKTGEQKKPKEKRTHNKKNTRARERITFSGKPSLSSPSPPITFVVAR